MQDIKHRSMERPSWLQNFRRIVIFCIFISNNLSNSDYVAFKTQYPFNRTICAILILIFVGTVQKTFAGNTKFKNYTPLEGLVHKTVFCIYMDSDNFLWIGTSSGLSRFDGYNFKNFTHINSDSTSLHGSIIHDIVEDANGKLWLATSAGIECFNKEKEVFTGIQLPKHNNTPSNKNIFADGDYIWAYNDSTHFVRINTLNKKAVYFDFLKDLQLATTKDEIVLENFVVHDKVIYLACNKGFFTYNLETKKFTQIIHKSLSYCYSIKKIDSSLIALTYMYDGTYLYNIVTKTGKWYDKASLEKHLGPNNAFYDAMLDNDGTVWIGTSPGMVSIKDSKVDYYNINSDEKYFSGDFVTSIYKDRNNSIWFGTLENGLYLMKDKEHFNIAKKLHQSDLSVTFARYIAVFSNNSLLYADYNGVYRCEDASSLVPGSSQKIIDSSFPSIYPVNDTQCLISFVDSVYLYNSITKQNTYVAHIPAIVSACIDKQGVFWFGTWFGTLQGTDLKNNKKYEIKLNSPIFTIKPDNDGSLWLGTFGQGLIHITGQTQDKPHIIKYNKETRNSINSNTIHCLHIDKQDNIWIGTSDDGLYTYDKRSSNFTSFTIDDGLKSNIIESISSDNEGNIWFTSQTITKYDITTNSFTHYSKHEGVPGTFVAKASAVSPEGILFFASTEGIVYFDPQKNIKKTDVPAPTLTGLRIHGNTIKPGFDYKGKGKYEKAITYSSTVSIPFEYNSFAIEFASLQFQDQQNILYEFLLSGIDQKWIRADVNNRLASYSGIGPGEYHFNVRSSNGNGLWSESEQLTIKIIPPWWQTWWFRLIVILSATLLITTIVLYRILSLKRINKTLEKKVLERTASLVQTNEALEENQLVIEMKNNQLNEALESKNELISVLAHDFKNPLQGILGISTLLEKEGDVIGNLRLRKFISTITSSANALSNQMFKVLDWVQSQENNMKASPTEINLEILLNDVISLERGNALKKEIHLSSQTNYKVNAFVDPRMISTVYRNLLANAIKFTPRKGTVLITIQEYDDCIKTTFKDTGVGVSDDLLYQIQNSNKPIKAAFGTENEKGSGLGLRLCNTFIEKNAGTMSISRGDKGGSIFVISLPKGKNKATKKVLTSNKESNETLAEVSSKKRASTILIIEDDLEIIESISYSFDSSYDIIKALDGKKGLNLAKRLLPDVIISDINVPGISGIEICSLLKKDALTNHIPIILITSHNDKEIIDSAFRSGANDFIEKPFNIFYLKKKIEGLLEYRLKSLEKMSINPHSINPEDRNDVIISKVVQFIQEHISDEKLNANAIAEHIGMSRSQLWRVFKQKTDKTLGDFMREIKMQKAASLLMSGKYRVSEVSDFVGFADARYFSKAFIKEFGITPSQYSEKFKIQ